MLPAKILASPKGRVVCRRQAADRHDAEFRGNLVAAIGLDAPAFFGFIEACGGDARVEQNVPAKVETVGDVVGVGEDFGLRRVFLRPVPLLVEFFREREGVLHALDVAARARIAVPVPGAADATARFIDPRRETKSAQAVQHVHAGESGADDNGVENRTLIRRTLLILLCSQPWKRLS